MKKIWRRLSGIVLLSLATSCGSEINTTSSPQTVTINPGTPYATSASSSSRVPTPTPGETGIITEPYDFPVTSLKMTEEEWMSISNVVKRMKNKIPPDIVNRMTTRALAESVVNYPLFPGLSTAYDCRNSLDVYMPMGDYTGLKELLERSDAPSVLLDMYQEYDFKAENAAILSADKTGLWIEYSTSWSNRLLVIEMYLARPEIWSGMDEEQLKNYNDVVIQKYLEKVEAYTEVPRGGDRELSLFILIKPDDQRLLLQKLEQLPDLFPDADDEVNLKTVLNSLSDFYK